MNNKKLLFCVLVCISTLILSSTTATHAFSVTNWKNSNSLMIEVTSAYYDDLEGDGVENDVYSSVYIKFSSFRLINELILYLDLELPSGKYFTYYIQLTFHYMYEVEIPIKFYNHATEEGDYILFAAIWFDDPFDSRLAYSECIFDPPGGHDGGDPPRIELF